MEKRPHSHARIRQHQKLQVLLLATYRLFGHSGGLGITYPELCIEISISGGMPGNGLLPRVTTSHRSIPNDHTSFLDVYFPLVRDSGLIHLKGSLP